MPCQILVSNKSSVEKAEIIVIFDGDHQWGTRETMRTWVLSGKPKEEWSRDFSLVIVSDKNKADLDYLLGALDNGMNRFYFKEPDAENELYIELYENGQVEAPFYVVNEYIIERT